MLITSGATETDVTTQNDKEIKQTNKQTKKQTRAIQIKNI